MMTLSFNTNMFTTIFSKDQSFTTIVLLKYTRRVFPVYFEIERVYVNLHLSNTALFKPRLSVSSVRIVCEDVFTTVFLSCNLMFKSYESICRLKKKDTKLVFVVGNSLVRCIRLYVLIINDFRRLMIRCH